MGFFGYNWVFIVHGGSIMADPSKFKSIGIDVSTYNKHKAICDKERRNIRQQIGLMVDKECERLNINNDNKVLGLGGLNRSHS